MTDHKTQEPIKFKMTGDIIDKIIYKDGRVEVIESHNLVVNSFLPLISSLLKRDSNYTGIQYWAIGSGSPSWDETLPSPQSTDTQLTSELGRVAIPLSEMVYLDNHFEESQDPTPILQIKHTFDENTLNGSWREFGIFGGNATSAVNSGYMINHKIHPLISKTSEMVVERTMRFTISLT